MYSQTLYLAGNGLAIFQDAIARKDPNTLNQIFANNKQLYDHSSFNALLDTVLQVANSRDHAQLRANTILVIQYKQNMKKIILIMLLSSIGTLSAKEKIWTSFKETSL